MTAQSITQRKYPAPLVGIDRARLDTRAQDLVHPAVVIGIVAIVVAAIAMR